VKYRLRRRHIFTAMGLTYFKSIYWMLRWYGIFYHLYLLMLWLLNDRAEKRAFESLIHNGLPVLYGILSTSNPIAYALTRYHSLPIMFCFFFIIIVALHAALLNNHHLLIYFIHVVYIQEISQ
jgi:uncharacterized membrane protein